MDMFRYLRPNCISYSWWRWRWWQLSARNSWEFWRRREMAESFSCIHNTMQVRARYLSKKSKQDFNISITSPW